MACLLLMIEGWCEEAGSFELLFLHVLLVVQVFSFLQAFFSGDSFIHTKLIGCKHEKFHKSIRIDMFILLGS